MLSTLFFNVHSFIDLNSYVSSFYEKPVFKI